MSKEEFYKKTLKELGKKYHYVILPAAIGDFKINKKKGKIKSDKKIELELIPRKKLVQEIKKKFPKQKIIAFKAVVNVSKEKLLEIAKNKLEKEKLEMVIANDVGKGGIGTEDNKVWIVTKNQEKWIEGKKSAIAREIIKQIYGN